MFLRWIPWKYLLRLAARSYGVIDPLTVLARIRQFSQSSEIQEPIELIRAGIVFQAKGLINTRVIQFNLDWVWPYWVEKQFNPKDLSFIPRAYSFSHINLTHRNWTAVGRPDLSLYPLVDPRGLVTPFYDGWSLDFWILTKDGRHHLLPSRMKTARQKLSFYPDLSVKTQCGTGGSHLSTDVKVVLQQNSPFLAIRVQGTTEADAWLVVSVRPYNTEGIHFIEKIAFHYEQPGWEVNSETGIEMSERPEKVLFSTFSQGDVYQKHAESEEEHQTSCKLGLASSAAFFPFSEDAPKTIDILVPLKDELERDHPGNRPPVKTWDSVMDGSARLNIPDEAVSYLYDCSVRTLLLLSAGEIYPGPYNYRRFWFRDACLMLQALLSAGFRDRCRRILDTFPERQRKDGYFLSQEGEWDSNGQVLWIMDRFHWVTGIAPEDRRLKAITKGARWIRNKRVAPEIGIRHGGLLPAGFSAEHFGPNDYYYWDDFWAVAGLRAAARLLGLYGSRKEADGFMKTAEDLQKSISKSVEGIPSRQSLGGIPASPYRRMDAGAIGTMVADYPLQLAPRGDTRIQATLEFLMKNCLHKDGFFQDMVHSGVNVYLTLALAQTLLRHEDPRYRPLFNAALKLASPTGQWPEAVHPFSGGGCMGDGQHGWASAEWFMIIRNMFVREEGNRLIIGSGIFPEWLQEGDSISFGPTHTSFGIVTIHFCSTRSKTTLHVDADFREQPRAIEVRVPGYDAEFVSHVERPHVLKSRG